MRTRLIRPNCLLFTVTTLLFLNAGCASRSKPTTNFPDAYKALMVSYRDKMNELAARPLPPPSLTREQRRIAVSRQIEDIADAYTDYEKRLDALQPPSAYREIQSTTSAFFKISADDNSRWAEAIRHGSPETQDQVEHEGEVNELAAMKRMQQALNRIGESSQKFQNLIDEQQRSVKN